MAHFEKRGAGWRAHVCVDRTRKTKTFPTKREAKAWADEQEQDGILARHTLRDAIKKYRPIAEAHKGSQAELSRLAQLEKMECVDRPLDQITPKMIGAYRDTRGEAVAPVSVRRELIILSAIFHTAVDEWHWLHKSPMESVKRPETSKARRRGIAQVEIDAITKELDKARQGPQVGQMFRFSLETGMRLGEIIGLRWADVGEKAVTLRDTKNGDARKVPLSTAAREIIKARENLDPNEVFTLSAHVASKCFQRARDAAGHPDVHFHDARSEAITRLSKKLDVLQLARMIGHRDIKSLLHYYAESAESMADRLG
ncbi:tyrosine-type recombinase/integrase [Aromatoleum anaerobium]|uniref:Tyrosine-type recombinase/integrase n=1 Tax=Aromatoleum anaerobium TaxID=182180 RepID=A0ABX1PMK8_9RHOO|nr:tyrosine-type recombinase/integrase [Aromatoleum anaerobium]MCK0507975.1 tyrosine-type recombinase/integrase [Aromatoleum anaerobium]